MENEDTENLWKKFGRETEAGKILYSLYKTGKPPQINYPKPKPRSQAEIQKSLQKQEKKCPQKTKIEYPEVIKEEKKIAAVELIPRRKRYEEIQEQIENYYKRVEYTGKKGVDRQKQIEEMQKLNKFSKGVLPLGAQKVALSKQEVEELEIEVRAKRQARDQEKQMIIENEKKNIQERDEMGIEKELDLLFDQVVSEIEERQQFLDSMKNYNESEIKERIKQEMVQRVSELQKITEMRKEFKKKKAQNQK